PIPRSGRPIPPRSTACACASNASHGHEERTSNAPRSRVAERARADGRAHLVAEAREMHGYGADTIVAMQQTRARRVDAQQRAGAGIGSSGIRRRDQNLAADGGIAFEELTRRSR